MPRQIPDKVSAGQTVSASWFNSLVDYMRYLYEQQQRRRIFEVAGDFSTWYEVTTSNRQSCSISGSFEVTTPAILFYMEEP